MTSQNRIVLTGKVVKPPRLRYRPDGSPVIQFSLVLNDAGDPSGQPPHRQGPGSLIEIVAIGRLAELQHHFLQSGQRLRVVGRLNQRRWQTPEGQHRTRTEVIATEMKPLEEKHSSID